MGGGDEAPRARRRAPPAVSRGPGGQVVHRGEASRHLLAGHERAGDQFRLADAGREHRQGISHEQHLHPEAGGGGRRGHRPIGTQDRPGKEPGHQRRVQPAGSPPLLPGRLQGRRPRPRHRLLSLPGQRQQPRHRDGSVRQDPRGGGQGRRDRVRQSQVQGRIQDRVQEAHEARVHDAGHSQALSEGDGERGEHRVHHVRSLVHLQPCQELAGRRRGGREEGRKGSRHHVLGRVGQVRSEPAQAQVRGSGTGRDRGGGPVPRRRHPRDPRPARHPLPRLCHHPTGGRGEGQRGQDHETIHAGVGGGGSEGEEPGPGRGAGDPHGARLRRDRGRAGRAEQGVRGGGNPRGRGRAGGGGHSGVHDEQARGHGDNHQRAGEVSRRAGRGGQES
mmetsp:Transcript_14295/g.31093  ORF Transcript_14295/g.31093 Transcript_14295/m.31093 type:complete len:390 (-) Transcript_14295:199-1368(-)